MIKINYQDWWNWIKSRTFIANRFLIYSYFITSGIFLIMLILWIVKRFGQLVESALYKLCYVNYVMFMLLAK